LKYLFSIFILSLSLSIQASDTGQDRYNSLFFRQELLHKSYREIYETLTDINKQESLKTWYRLLLETNNFIEYYNINNEILSYNILGKDYRLLLYYFAVTGQVTQAQQTLGLYLLSAYVLLDNISQDPQAKSWNPEVINRITLSLKDFQSSYNDIKSIQKCFAQSLNKSGVKRQFDPDYSFFLNQAIELCVDRNPFVYQINSMLKYVFIHHKYPGAPFPVSFSGYVHGNNVTLLNRLPREQIDILNLGEQLELILTAVQPKLNKSYKDLTIPDYKDLMKKPEDAIEELFTSEEGFANTIEAKNISDFSDSVLGPWAGNNLGMYAEMLQAIRNAKHSVFVDIFWMGGSIGMNLAKELISKVIKDPNFSVIILTDNENKFQYGTQLDMIYRYMRSFSEKFTEFNFYITPSQINLKRTALPEFADLLITNNIVNDLNTDKNIKSFLEKDGFHLLAKSDHTKAIIVDGKPSINDGKIIDDGIAFVGSKNWTDSSGGVNEDEVAKIEGPAVAIILNTFYYDAYEAFDLDMQIYTQGEMVKNHLQIKAPQIPKKQGIQKLLSPIDVFNRHSGADYSIPFTIKGSSTIAPTQNNIYGTEMSPIEQNIQIILNAKHQVLIDDQFLYDPKIIEALKYARLTNNIEIYIILESLITNPTDENGEYLHNQNGSLVYNKNLGIVLPNNLFIPELSEVGIKIKPYIVPDNVVLATGLDQKKFKHPLLATTFHVKSLSADGVLKADSETCQSIDGALLSEKINSTPVTVSGSANKDIMTMSGGFRESQVAIFDEESVIAHDCLFWARWNNSPHEVDGLDFDLPEQAIQFGIKDKKTFLNFLRQVLFAPYNFTKELF
jgi:phosphatidylserine/phosphatidylglycerophosphate/cardiolipin synthase-like enzyme